MSQEIAPIIRLLQNRLFDLGADLATPLPSARETYDHTPNAERANVTRIGQRHIEEIEKQIDAVCEQLEPLQQFILPGGSEAAARVHLARSICRRAERRCLTLQRQSVNTPVMNPTVLIYLNRMSDLLFAIARRANQLCGTQDVAWESC